MALSSDDRAVLLREAIERVSRVRRAMDTRFRVCQECELKRYLSLRDRKLANRLEGVERSLVNAVEELCR